MDGELKAHLEREIRRYRLAQSDMEQARFAAQVIPTQHRLEAIRAKLHA